jgi:OTU-like cysteine protease
MSTAADTATSYKLQHLLKQDASNATKWDKEMKNLVTVLLSKLGKCVNAVPMAYPNLDTDPEYSMAADVIMTTYGFTQVTELSDSLKNASMLEARKNRTALNNERQRFCNLIMISLEEITRAKLTDNGEFVSARSTSDPLQMLQIIDKMIIEPSAQSQVIVQRQKLNNITFSDMEKDGARLAEEWNTFLYFRNKRTNTPLSQEDENEYVTALLNGLDHRYTLFKQGVFIAMKDSAKTPTTATPTAVAPPTFLGTISNAQDFAKKMNIVNQQSQTARPTVMYSGKDKEPNKVAPCKTCGSQDHRRNDCDIVNPKCDTCEKQGKAEWIVKSHTTAGHVGTARNRREPRESRYKRTPQRKVNFANDDVDDDEEEEEQAHALSAATCLMAFQTNFQNAGTFDVETVPKDGHCAYESLSRATGVLWQQLRLQTAHFLGQNLVEPVLDDPEITWGYVLSVSNEGKTFDEILSAIETNQYGGDVEFRALEHILKRGIRVYQRLESNFQMIAEEGLVGEDPICLLWSRGQTGVGDHYDLLRATNQKKNYLMAARSGVSKTDYQIRRQPGAHHRIHPSSNCTWGRVA